MSPAIDTACGLSNKVHGNLVTMYLVTLVTMYMVISYLSYHVHGN